jgi:hypothetical protein
MYMTVYQVQDRREACGDEVPAEGWTAITRHTLADQVVRIGRGSYDAFCQPLIRFIEPVQFVHPNRLVSRMHCEVIRQEDQVLIVNRSPNGTSIEALDGEVTDVENSEGQFLLSLGTFALFTAKYREICPVPWVIVHVHSCPHDRIDDLIDGLPTSTWEEGAERVPAPPDLSLGPWPSVNS